MKYFENKRINKTTNKINNLKSACVSKRIGEVRVPLERVNIALANRNIPYTRSRANHVNAILDNISRHLSNQYVEFIKNDCSAACDVINGVSIELSKEQSMIKQDEIKITELENKLRDVSSRMATVSERMEDVLGKDEIAWKRLNLERKSLSSQYMAINKAFDTMINQTNNLRLAETIRSIREQYSDPIINQQTMVDVEQFKEDCNINQFAGEETRNQSEEMQTALHGYCEDDDDEYRRALEAKMLKSKSTSSTKSSSKEGSLSDGASNNQ